MTVDFSIVGKRIQIIRKQKKISQEQLASMIGISEGHIGHIERGTKVPGVEILIQIADALNVSVDELLIDLNAPHNEDTSINELLKDCTSEEKGFLKELITYLKPHLKKTLL